MVTVKSKMAELTTNFTDSINALTTLIRIFKFVAIFVFFMILWDLDVVVLLIICMSNVNVGVIGG